MFTNSTAKLLICAAWASMGFIAFATLTHVDFVYGIYFQLASILPLPEMGTYAHFEHVIAFAICGALFCFAYSRNVILVCSVVVISAIVLELLQTLTLDRHGTLVDAAEKIAGGAIGIIFAKTYLSYLSSTTRSRPAKSR